MTSRISHCPKIGRRRRSEAVRREAGPLEAGGERRTSAGHVATAAGSGGRRSCPAKAGLRGPQAGRRARLRRRGHTWTRKWRSPSRRRPARRVDGADTHRRLRAPGVRLRPRSARRWWNSAGSAGTRPGSAANSLPAANRAGTWGPATGMATRDAGGGGEPPELSVPSRRACPAQCVWLASAGEAAPPGAESRPRAAPPRPSGRRARARGGQ